MLDFTHDMIGMNGEYYNITYVGPNKPLAPSTLEVKYIILVSVGSIAFVLLVICVFVKK